MRGTNGTLNGRHYCEGCAWFRAKRKTVWCVVFTGGYYDLPRREWRRPDGSCPARLEDQEQAKRIMEDMRYGKPITVRRERDVSAVSPGVTA